MLELEIIPTQSLIDELCKRCSPAVFIGTKYDESGEEKSWKSYSKWQGNLETCRGLLHEMDATLQREMIRQELQNERANSEED